MFDWLRKIWNNQTSGLQTPQQWLIDALTDDSSTGIPVNNRTAIRLAPLFGGCKRISNDCAKIPLHLYRKTANGRERATSHPAAYMMRYKPSPEINAFTFIQSMIYNAIIHGNSYAYIVRDGNFLPEELIPLESSRTFPVRVNGQLWYVYRPDQGPERKISPSNMLHFKGLSADAITGIPLLDYASELIGTGLSTQKYTNNFFSNHAMPGGVISLPTRLDNDMLKQIRTQWNAMHEGLNNSHRVAILEKGRTFTPISVSNDQNQLVQLRKLNISDVATILSIPEHMVGSDTRTSHASLEAENASYLDNTLEPWLVSFEFECFDKLLTEKQKRSDEYYFEFLRSAILRPDTKARYDIYGKGIQWGILSPNECRALENLERRDDEDGDKYLSPKNMRLGDENKEKEDNNEENNRYTGSLNSHKKLLATAANKLLRWEASAVQRAAKKPDKFISTIEEFYNKHKIKMVEGLTPVADAINELGVDIKIESWVENHIQESLDMVLEAAEVSPDELEKSISNLTKSWSVKINELIDLGV